MKNKFILATLFFVISIFIPLQNLKANANKYTTYTYAQIVSNNVYLYKSNASIETSNAYFCLPESYFVLLISNIDDYFYKAQYRDKVGYVLKEEVIPVAETPQNPYLENISFRVYSSDGVNILNSPTDTKTNQIVNGTVELLDDDIDYYGQIYGDEYITGRGKIWYYCKYTKNNLSIEGYLYKGLCDELTTIKQNTETVTQVSSPFLDNDTDYLYNLIDMPMGLKIFLIIIIVIPSFVLVYLMFRPYNLERLNKKHLKKRKLKHKIKTLNKIQQIIDDEPL